MTKEKLIQKKRPKLIELIKEKTDYGKKRIPFRYIFPKYKIEKIDDSSAIELFSLLFDNKIELELDRRNTKELNVFFTEHEENEPADLVKDILKSVLFYSALITDKSLDQFHYYTGNYFEKHALFQFAEKANLDYLELIILVKTFEGFTKGRHPLFLNDIGFSFPDLANSTEVFISGKSSLINQSLIGIEIDMDGISIVINLTLRTLQLMQDKELEILEQVQETYHKFFIYKPAKTLKKIDLFYNNSISKFYSTTKELIKMHDQWKTNSLSILLHGPSGTGKTEFVYQIAREAGADIMHLEFSQIQSKFLGETEKNIKKVFDDYKKLNQRNNRPIIMLANEADSLLNRRVSIRTSNDVFNNHSQAQLLEQLENFTGIFIATTNLQQNIDTAFDRRFLFKYKIDYPNPEVKHKLIQNTFLPDILSESIIKQLVNTNWTPAILRNFTNKIKQLRLLNNFNEQDIIDLLKEEGMIGKTGSLGYKINKD